MVSDFPDLYGGGERWRNLLKKTESILSFTPN